MRMKRRIGRLWNEWLGDGGGNLLTQWLAKYGYLPIVLIGMAGLALEMGTGEWKSDDTIVTNALLWPRRLLWPRLLSSVRRPCWKSRACTSSCGTERRAPAEPSIELAALGPDTRLESESDQPASKGYIMYANSPTNWTPVPLPAEISEAAHAPRNNNIRVEIEQAAMLFNVDVRMMKAFARIESGYDPRAKTGRYKCLFQLSEWEFAKYWKGDIYDIRDCSIAAARKFATEAAEFEKDVGRKATAANSTASTSKGIKAVRFITTRHSSWHGRTCT